MRYIFAIAMLLATCIQQSCSDMTENGGPRANEENDDQFATLPSELDMPIRDRWPAADDDVEYNSSPDIVDEEEIKVAAFENIGRFLKSVEYPLVNVFGETVFDNEIFAWRGEVSGQFSPIDRTLETPLMEPEMFTVEYVRHVQQTLLRQYPLWRFHVVGTRTSGESSLMIYPDAVRVGKTLCPPADLSLELDRWRNEILAIRDKSAGARLRQFTYVKERLPELIEKLKEEPVVYVASFDNWRGQRDSHSFWFLQKDDYEFMPTIPEGVGHGDTFGVDAEGRVPVPLGPSRFCYLCQWTFPPADNYEIVFREYVWKRFQYELNEDSKAEWRFQISGADVLRDADLPR